MAREAKLVGKLTESNIRGSSEGIAERVDGKTLGSSSLSAEKMNECGLQPERDRRGR